MQKIAIYIVLLAAFISYLTFAPPNQFLINIEPVAYRSVLIFLGELVIRSHFSRTSSNGESPYALLEVRTYIFRLSELRVIILPYLDSYILADLLRSINTF